jgi:hypothetical protein
MDARSRTYGGLEGVRAGPVLVGLADAFSPVVCGVWSLSSGVANAFFAMVSVSHSTSLFRHCNTLRYCDTGGDSRAYLHANTDTNANVYSVSRGV